MADAGPDADAYYLEPVTLDDDDDDDYNYEEVEVEEGEEEARHIRILAES